MLECTSPQCQGAQPTEPSSSRPLCWPYSGGVCQPVCVTSMITDSDLGKKNILLSDLVKNYLSGNKFNFKKHEQIHIFFEFLNLLLAC